MTATAAEWASFLAGVLAMGQGVVALFFFRFWRRTGDRLFLFFATSFVLLAVQRIALTMTGGTQAEGAIWYYLLRLGAFLLIIIAIIDKNRAR